MCSCRCPKVVWASWGHCSYLQCIVPVVSRAKGRARCLFRASSLLLGNVMGLRSASSSAEEDLELLLLLSHLPSTEILHHHASLCGAGEPDWGLTSTLPTEPQPESYQSNFISNTFSATSSLCGKLYHSLFRCILYIKAAVSYPIRFYNLLMHRSLRFDLSGLPRHKILAGWKKGGAQ